MPFSLILLIRHAITPYCHHAAAAFTPPCHYDYAIAADIISPPLFSPSPPLILIF
jgi:hypothetical protein